MSSTDTLIDRYVRLLVFQYKLEKAQDTIAIYVKQILGDGFLQAIRDGFDVGTAVGPQLDILGKYIGLPRTIGVPVTLPFFGFVRYSGVGDNDNGFRSYSTADNSSGVFYRYGYSGTRNTALSDTSYQFMIALQIILNSSDGTLASIQRYLASLLPGAVTVTDNQDMTLTYTITGQLPVDPTVLQAYLPKPMGVGITIKTNDFIVTDGGDGLVTTAPGGAPTTDRIVTTVP